MAQAESANERDTRLKVQYAKAQAARAEQIRQARSLAAANLVKRQAAAKAAEPTREIEPETPAYQAQQQEPPTAPTPNHTPLGRVTVVPVTGVPWPLYIAGLDRVVTISILPLSTNSGNFVYLGGPDVSANSSYQIAKGATYPLLLENVRLGDIYLLVTTANDGVNWSAS